MNTRLRTLIADTLGLSEDRVEPGLRRESVDNWDSLNHLRLVTALEEAFGVKLKMSEIQEIQSVEDICRLIGGD